MNPLGRVAHLKRSASNGRRDEAGVRLSGEPVIEDGRKRKWTPLMFTEAPELIEEKRWHCADAVHWRMNRRLDSKRSRARVEATGAGV